MHLFHFRGLRLYRLFNQALRPLVPELSQLATENGTHEFFGHIAFGVFVDDVVNRIRPGPFQKVSFDLFGASGRSRSTLDDQRMQSRVFCLLEFPDRSKTFESHPMIGAALKSTSAHIALARQHLQVLSRIDPSAIQLAICASSKPSLLLLLERFARVLRHAFLQLTSEFLEPSVLRRHCILR